MTSTFIQAKSLTGIMTKLHSCKHRFGFTGTLDGTETHRLVLEGLFGPVEKVTTTKELMDKKSLADLKIKCLVLKHSNVRERMTYAEELKHLGTLDARNEFISSLLFHIPGNTLCLFQLVENQGQLLYDKVIDTRDNGFFDDRRKKVFFIYAIQALKKEKRLGQPLKMQKILLQLRSFMGLLALVLIFATLTTSCSQVRVNLKYECYNQSEEDCVRVKLSIPF